MDALRHTHLLADWRDRQHEACTPVAYAIDYSAGLSRIVARDEARSESPPAYRRSLDDRQRIVTIASVSFKLSTFESTEVATTLSILKAVVPDGAVVRDPEVEDRNLPVCYGILAAGKSARVGVRILRTALERFARIHCCAAYLGIAFYFHQLRREDHSPVQGDWRPFRLRIRRDLERYLVAGRFRDRRGLKRLSKNR